MSRRRAAWTGKCVPTPTRPGPGRGRIRYLGAAMESGIPRRPLARIAIALLAAVVVALVAGCGRSGTAGSGGRAQTIGVSGAAVGRPIPAGFVGLSMEFRALLQYTGTNPKAIDPVLLHLLQAIAPKQRPVLRIGGDSTDWTWWPVAHTTRPPGVRFDLTPTWMRVARAVATRLDAKLILGVNLESGSHAVASAEARAMVDDIGRSFVDALEIGNEPELYGSFGWYRSPRTGRPVLGRARGYDVPAFIGELSSLAPRLPEVPLAGPASGAMNWLASLDSFLGHEPRVRLVTVHAYPLKHCEKTTVVTSPELLSDLASRGLAEGVAPYLAVAARHHVPLRVDEMNGISCGGTRGVSDTFTSALWVLDALFEMANTGVTGVNIHTVPGAINEVLGPEFSHGAWQIAVHPEYYGMIMFAQAAPPGSHLLRLSSTAPAGVKVWATRAPGGTIHVVVINKRLAGAAMVGLRIASARGVADVEQLRAPSAQATGQVTLGGQTFGPETSTGLLAGTADERTVSPSSGAYTVRVPAASATMLTLPAPR
jgi:hypothetical protein